MAYSVEARGRRIVYTGDTGPDEALGHVGERLRRSAGRVLAAGLDGHGDASHAVAVRRVRRRGRSPGVLALTHFYPPVETVDIRGEVGARFDGTRRARHGRVVSRSRGTVMLVVMQTDATQADIDRVCGAIKEMGYQAVPMPGGQRTAIGLVGNDGRVDDSRISALAGRRAGHSRLEAVQAGVARVATREHDRADRARRARSAGPTSSSLPARARWNRSSRS